MTTSKQSSLQQGSLPAHTFYPREELVSVNAESAFYRWTLKIVASLPDGYIVDISNSSGRLIQQGAHTRKCVVIGAFLTLGWQLYRTCPDTIGWRATREGMVAQARQEAAVDRILAKLPSRCLPLEPHQAAKVRVSPLSCEVPERRVVEVPSYQAGLNNEAESARLDPTNLI